MRIKEIKLIMAENAVENDLKQIMEAINAVPGVEGISVTCCNTKAERAERYDLTLPVPLLIRAEVGAPELRLPETQPDEDGQIKTVPMVQISEHSRPLVTQDWLIDKARKIHNPVQLMGFFRRYKRFCDKNGLTQWFKMLCDDRSTQIRRAANPEMPLAEENLVLPTDLSAQQETQVREEVVRHIREIKGPEYSLLDLFMDAKGRIPYTDETKIPIDRLIEKLDELEASGDGPPEEYPDPPKDEDE